MQNSNTVHAIQPVKPRIGAHNESGRSLAAQMVPHYYKEMNIQVTEPYSYVGQARSLWVGGLVGLGQSTLK